MPGAVVCLDFEKAFDSLDWKFMIKSLKRYGFGDYFTRWIKILYTSPTYCIKNNGWIWKESAMNRGIRQGCAVSALLFILAVEFLSVQIKQNENVKGITIFKAESKLLQYADDSTLTLTDSQSISYALQEIEIFSAATGLQLNVNKSEGLWLGTLKPNKLNFEGISFSEGPIKCLGIYVGTNIENCSSLNWDKKVNDIDILLSKWKKRKLTLIGKSVVLKRLVMPKLVYYMTVLNVPNTIVKKLDSMFFNFLWGKTHKVPKATVIGNQLNGGLEIPDIESKIKALKVSWIPKILNKENQLFDVLQMILRPLGIDINQLLKMNFRTKTGLDVLSRIPKFYQDIFIYFNVCKTIKPAIKLNNIELFSQIIWRNEYFKMNDQYLFYKNWLESGFIYVKDLFDKEGSWLTETAILCKLKNKTNWIAEWTLIKKVVSKQTKKFDSTICPYIQNSIFKQTRFFANE